MEVKIGQVWQDCDKRFPDRRIKVHSFITDANGAPTHARLLTQDARGPGGWSVGPTTKISIRRMKPGSTGYRLVY